MPHMEASDPETSWKSAAKETAPWSQSGRLQEFTVCLDFVPTVNGMEDFFPAHQVWQSPRLQSLGSGGLMEQSC